MAGHSPTQRRHLWRSNTQLDASLEHTGGSIIDYQYYLHATGRSAFVPSKASFFNALRGGGIELKHVKVGSIRLAAAVRALPAATRSGPVWHPSGSHLDRPSAPGTAGERPADLGISFYL